MTLNIPDGLPVLSSGAHPGPRYGACFMEFTALLAGEPFNDHPTCVDPQLGRVMQMINDRLNEEDRIKLVPLLGRAIGLVAPGRGDVGDHRIPMSTQHALNTVASGILARKLGVADCGSVTAVFNRAEGLFARDNRLGCGCGCGQREELVNFRIDAAVKVHEAYEEAMAKLGWKKAQVEIRGVEKVLPEIKRPRSAIFA